VHLQEGYSSADIDQSGKVGITSHHTVLALSDSTCGTVLIPAAVKRTCIVALRGQGIAPTTIYLRLFVSGLYYLMRDFIGRVDYFVIDVEYPGHDQDIRRQLLNFLRRDGLVLEPDQVVFELIGKQSRAHKLALTTFRNEVIPDRVLTTDMILRLLSRQNK
jgi:hypothetical protein